ncbi:alpha/beta hydrolase [Flavobacterium sp. MFBS3-15]|uniref:alpha/beta hydrolase n=1 Tax=Flavobacterium sp. MFBS3-15 TaxID=2989816 RepID=UPI0022364120|nr:alpha/beta hydrolase [Flavobacterium sp. MFBS3-15]MCW4467717.1 alpha/beta hydrolase [Flavobacterium sp. MFBS3-15]
MKLKAQEEIISIWVDPIPGAIAASNYNEDATFKDGILQKISKVTIPTLTVYSPKKIKSNGTAVLIFPGGGYAHLSIDKEGKKVAEWLNTQRITAFVLKYRLFDERIMTNKETGPLQDAQKAMRLIRQNASKWGIDPNNIGVLGFSAGGHLAATLCTRYNEIVYSEDLNINARPDFALLIYPVISMRDDITHQGSRKNLLGASPSAELVAKHSNESQVSTETPPTFLVHASDDLSVPVENSINYFLALKKNNVAAELHIYEKGKHGFGLGVEGTSKFWTLDCISWLKTRKIIP